MDFLGLISSVSRLAIAAFVITLIVVAYEVFLIVRRKRLAPQKDTSIAVPEFTGDAKPGTFSPVAVGESAKQPFTLASRKISRNYVYTLLVLLVLIVVGTGFLIYKRSTLSSPDVKVTDVSPVAKNTGTISPTQSQTIPTRDPFIPGGASSQTTTLTPTNTQVTPTVSVSPLTPTSTVTPTNAPGMTGTVTPTVTLTSSPTVTSSPTGTLSPTVTSTSTNQKTGTPSPTASAQLPQSGSYQTTLMISLVSIAIIYLALIL